MSSNVCWDQRLSGDRWRGADSQAEAGAIAVRESGLLRAAFGLGVGTVGRMPDTGASAAQEILRDAFTRLIEHVDDLTGGLADEVATYRPTPEANTIAWLIWHSARVQDVQVCERAKT